MVGAIGGTGQYILAHEGPRLYLSTENIVGVFDISDPGMPVEVGWVGLKPADRPASVSALAVEAGWLYAVDGVGNLTVLDARGPGQPRQVGYLPHLGGLASGNGFPWVRGHLVPWGDLLFVGMSGAPDGDLDISTEADYRLVAIDVSDRARPTVAGSKVVGTPFGGLARVGNNLIAITNEREFSPTAMDLWVLAPTASLTTVARLPLDQQFVWDVVVMGDRLVSIDLPGRAGPRSQLTTFDLSDPAHPVVLGRAGPSLQPAGTPILPDAYPAAVATNRAPPNEVDAPFSRCQPAEEASGFMRDAVAEGDHLVAAVEGVTCLVDGSSTRQIGVYGLQVIDLADPTDLRQLGSLVLPAAHHSSLSLVLADGYAYAVWGDRLGTIDVRRPDAPRLEARVPLPSSAWTVLVPSSADGLVLAGDTLVDASDPSDMKRVGDAKLVGVLGDASVVLTTDGIAIHDWTDGALGTELAQLALPGQPLARRPHPVLQGDRVYVAYGRPAVAGQPPPLELEGIAMVDLRDPAHPDLAGSLDVRSLGGGYPPAVGTDGNGEPLRAMALAEGDLVVAAGERLMRLNVEASPGPQVLVEAAIGAPVRDLAAGDGWLAAMTEVPTSPYRSNYDIRLVDFRDRGLSTAGVIPLPEASSGQEPVLAASGQRLYVVDRDSLRVYDVSNLSEPRQLLAWKNPYIVFADMAVSGGTLFLATGGSGLIALKVDG